LDKRQFQRSFNQAIELSLPVELGFLAASGAFARYNADQITLTPKGRYLMLVMMREFFAGINTIRDQARQQVAVCALTQDRPAFQPAT
jgi:menaquinone C8-methyltransferase